MLHFALVMCRWFCCSLSDLAVALPKLFSDWGTAFSATGGGANDPVRAVEKASRPEHRSDDHQVARGRKNMTRPHRYRRTRQGFQDLPLKSIC